MTEDDRRAAFEEMVGDAPAPAPGTVDPDTDTPPTREVHSGQLRIAERFVRAYTDKLLFIHGLGWHYWCGTHWVEDKDGKARRRLIELLKQIRHEAADMLEAKERDALLADARRCESAGGLTGVLDIAKHLKPMTVAAEHINGHPHLFNAHNGTYNLNTGALQRHNPGEHITKCAGTYADPSARSDLWTRFLEEVLPDQDVRAYLQRMFGVALLGSVREHTLPILTGTGGNGKSVLIDGVLAAFGDYGLTVDPKLIMKTKHERHGTFLADLHGARLVVTSETDDGDVLAAATVKRLTGGDRIRANRMRENTFEFEPSHTLVYVTNHKPQVSADDRAMWRRLSVVPFDVTVERPDVKLPEKLKRELPAILAWVIEGWLQYSRQGLNPPAAVTERTSEYQAESDPIAQFMGDMCIENHMASVKANALFAAWQAWQFSNSVPPITQQEFGRRMTDRGFERVRGSAGFKYRGLGLAAEEALQGGFGL